MKKLIALVLILVCVLGMVGCSSAARKALYSDGPWGSQAIWTDSMEQLYLVCTKGEADTVATVTAYLPTFTDWAPMEFVLSKDASSVSFIENGRLAMEAKIRMNGEKLLLTEFSAPNGGILPMNINLELIRYAYEEMLGQLPFIPSV